MYKPSTFFFKQVHDAFCGYRNRFILKTSRVILPALNFSRLSLGARANCRVHSSQPLNGSSKCGGKSRFSPQSPFVGKWSVSHVAQYLLETRIHEYRIVTFSTTRLLLICIPNVLNKFHSMTHQLMHHRSSSINWAIRRCLLRIAENLNFTSLDVNDLASRVQTP